MAPQRDLLWEIARSTAPDVTDFTARHQRGKVRLPYAVNAAAAGALVDAWVCCDPVCGGVELSAYLIELNHGCCTGPRCCDEHIAAAAPPRQHTVGYGTVRFAGYHRGPFTAWWEP